MSQPAEGVALVVGAVILHGGRAYVQRRASDQRLFPGSWDIAGGHVKEGETIEEALRREIGEETGWKLRRVLGKITEMCWEVDGRRRLELDFAVEVDGDLDRPRLDATEHVEWRWVDLAELPLLVDQRDPVEKAVHDIVELALHG